MFTPLMLIKNFLSKHNIGAYIIFLTDEHDNEYISESDNYLKYLTGFSGSNGYGVIMDDDNLLYTDSRYFIQAARELKNKFRLMKMGEDAPISEFLQAKSVERVGYNPLYISKAMFKRLDSGFKEKGIDFVAIDENPVVWPDMPEKIFLPIVNLEKVDLENLITFTKNKRCASWFEKIIKMNDGKDKGNSNNKSEVTEKEKSLVTGESYTRKINKIKDFIKPNEAYLLTLLDSIAWVFNLRGSDIAFNPLFYSFAYITKNETILFTKDEKIKIDGVEIRDYSKFYDFLASVAEEKIYSSDRVNRKIDLILGKKLETVDFVENLKSIKNEIELLGFFEAAIHDGVALCRLFGWIEDSIATKKITENDVSMKLVKIKKEFRGFVSPSFETIAAFGPNAAEVHHRSSDRLLEKDGLFLLDSGSQYLFGTTDITRTVCFGEPTAEYKKFYTLVLKGQIDAKMLKGPADSLGMLIQNMPRIWLWKVGEDYGHSTSHGVGHNLNVHESPPIFNTTCKLRENQVFSIEPGFYKENEFGIRIEDVVVSVRSGKFLEIKNLTLVPLHLALIDWSLLNKDETDYIKEYNTMVYECLSVFMNDEAGMRYLKQNTSFN